MKITVSAEVKPTKVGQSTLEGKELVAESVGMGHVIYQFQFEANKKYHLISAFGDDRSHVYYFLTGKADVQTSNGTTFTAQPHTVLAMTGDISADITCQDRACVVAIYTPCLERKGKVTVRRLEEMDGTDRDVNWGNGRSRRFLIKSDGFNIGICNSWAYKNKKSNLEYKNHLESVIWYWGRGKYHWDDDRSHQPYDLVAGNGDVTGETVTMIMDKHDPHLADIGDEDSVAVSVFSPPLIGNERHNIDGSSHSSY